MIHLIVAFLSGSILTVVVLAAGILGWLYWQSHPAENDTKEEKPYIRPQLPQVIIVVFFNANNCHVCVKSLQHLLGVDGSGLQLQEESCHWVNLLGVFLFNELRDSEFVKR